MELEQDSGIRSGHVAGVEVRSVDSGDWGIRGIHSFGVISGGAELMTLAWSRLDFKFSVRHENEVSTGTPSRVITGPQRLPLKLLNNCPVDLLVVERGHFHKPPTAFAKTTWMSMVESTSPAHQPKIIIESWAPAAQLWAQGPMSKAQITQWRDRGYESRCRLVRATDVGGAIRQARSFVVRIKAHLATKWQWDSLERDTDLVRPMANLLIPPGLAPRSSYAPGVGSAFPDVESSPMPNRVGARVSTSKGVRRLQTEEVARGLGVPKGSDKLVQPSTLERTTSLFHWEYLSYSLSHMSDLPPAARVPTGPENQLPDDVLPSPTESTFHWKTPNLEVGGPWHSKRLTNLRRASDCYPDSEEVYQDGLERLRIHNDNYDSDGPDPKRLQLLWWEFPPEHWEDLRLGARQNFLKQPTANIRPNAPMDEEMTKAGAEFVDELLELGVVRTIDEGRQVWTNAPMFVVPKPGQEGQWRVIADLLRGGQNECVGQDPVFMPRISHILDGMYTGGYSAVVDLSKFFYNFPTHVDDRPFLGLLHPVTQKLYAYFGLAMGAGNSPALAGRFGLAFVRLVRDKFHEFQGKGRANCYWTGFRDNGFDPNLGYGFILEGSDGGAVLIWVWVDDFLLHGPSEEKTARALRFFLDTAVDCGFLFHPKKLVPPAQVVKYCGFLFDTTSIPSLRVPVAKRERALAICEHLYYSSGSRDWSRLSLAVAAGTLESLSEATPQRLGHTYLRHFHTLVHPPGLGTGAEPYYTCTRLNEPVRKELSWWISYLTAGQGRMVRPVKARTLSPNFGDGSGTGTGGTIHLPRGPLQQWKGKWHQSVRKYPSVWKELATLKEMLLRIKEQAQRESVRGAVVFYFTDNSGVYWIALSGSAKKPDLHILIEDIRMLELELGCQLEVVHVPGLVLITQGTDGLSRGIWMNRLNKTMDNARLTQAIFDPLPYDPTLVWEHLPSLSHLACEWTYYDWTLPWRAEFCFDRLTVWFPPPEIARQCLTFFLNSWVERSYTTSGLFFIPRVMEGSWRYMSKYVTEISVIYPHKTPLRLPPILPIPIVVLYVAPHVRALKPSTYRMAGPSIPSDQLEWHQQEAAKLRGLPTRDLTGG